MSERGEDKPIDYMPTSLKDSHSTWPIWFTDTETETKPRKGRDTHCNIVIRCKNHNTSDDVDLSLVCA